MCVWFNFDTVGASCNHIRDWRRIWEGGYLCNLFSVVCRCDGHIFGDASCLCGLVASCTRMLQGRKSFLFHHFFLSSVFQSRGGVCGCCVACGYASCNVR